MAWLPVGPHRRSAAVPGRAPGSSEGLCLKHTAAICFPETWAPAAFHPVPLHRYRWQHLPHLEHTCDLADLISILSFVTNRKRGITLWSWCLSLADDSLTLIGWLGYSWRHIAPDYMLKYFSKDIIYGPKSWAIWHIRPFNILSYKVHKYKISCHS